MRRNIFRNSLFYLLAFIIIVAVASWITGNNGSSSQTELSSTEFVQQLDNNNVESFSLQPTAGIYRVEGKLNEPIQADPGESNQVDIFSSSNEETDRFITTILQNDPIVAEIYAMAQANDTQVIPLEEEQPSIWVSMFISLLPLIIFIFLIYFMMNQAGQGGGGRNVMSFGKSKAKLTDPSESKVRFSDVAGADEEKSELVEIVEFLKDPRRFSSLGARIPAGVLLEGPPGTGKTLLAKAVAGEAGVPFYSISGSEFVEMFVGVGASRVRDLFEEAKKKSPAIIFIDEIDAVGRKRGGSGMGGGGNDEREQTLNQLLVEMDGFQGNEGVIVMAATNRSDVLDQALLRPGRFDRRIMVGMPDVKEREAILKVHAKDKPLADTVNLKQVAKTTPGFSGADLENLLNESAIVAARRHSTIIEAYDVDEAADRVIAGPAKRDRVISEKERKMVAYHEAGHTIVGMVLSDARVVHKVTIIPRGRAGGYAIMLPREDQYLYTKKDLYEQIVGLLGGRAAEEIFFNTQTSGASNDFEQATNLARAMVTQYGMSDDLGPVQYEKGNEQSSLERSYSERVAYEIDEEVLNILSKARQEAHDIINDHRQQLEIIAEKLLEVETLNAIEIKSLFETGQMPEDRDDMDYPSEEEAEPAVKEAKEEAGTSFEEIREKTVHQERQREERYDDHHGTDSDEASLASDPSPDDESDPDPGDESQGRNDHIDQDHRPLDDRHDDRRNENVQQDRNGQDESDDAEREWSKNDWD